MKWLRAIPKEYVLALCGGTGLGMLFVGDYVWATILFAEGVVITWLWRDQDAVAKLKEKRQ